MEYAARFEPAKKGGFVITIPDFGWGVSQGDTEAEAREMAVALLQTMIQEHIRCGEPIPQPTKRRGSKYRLIRLPALDAAKTALYQIFLQSGLRKSQLARRLKIPKTTVDRLFDLRNHTRLDQIESAFRALGKQISIDIRDAA